MRFLVRRRLLTTALALVVAGTAFSFGYNAATAGRAREPAGMEFVSAGATGARPRRRPGLPRRDGLDTGAGAGAGRLESLPPLP
jgi:hypothetical protein